MKQFFLWFWRTWFAWVVWFWRLLTGLLQPKDALPPEPQSRSETPSDKPTTAPALRNWRASSARKKPALAAALADISQFIDGQFTSALGQRSYKLFIPAAPDGGAAPPKRPLIVMLHGCKQDPDDFATGTRMNALAQSAQCLVLYPAQSRWVNPYGCWNWFNPGDQQRGLGEPALLAGMAQAVAAEHQADAGRIYAAGLSAGGAMAVTLAHTYPELFAAIGVHSGLAYGVARDVQSAMQAMKLGDQTAAAVKLTLPMIVFQGDADDVVHPRNADALLAQAGYEGALALASASRPQDAASAGHACTCVRFGSETSAPGEAMPVEYWQVKGLGHAWSGGDAVGSFTDPLGPDASAQMLRFFLAQKPRV
ncbi:MAG: alpha/beta hydrolase family esterase [Burkholderiaceae bacterium]